MHLFSRAGILCAGLFVLCLLLARPFAEIGINDDWVYCLTAQDLARTGRLVFHGWAAPLLGWQAFWGALFVKLFGPTYTALRLSTLCVGAATVLLYHAILRRFGLNSVHATFGTLVLAVGPVFFVLSATFMTDVPCLFAILFTVYLCQLALASPSAKGSITWLTAAALSNIVFGSVRQIAWLGLLVIVPSCAWLLRRRRHVIPVTIALWLIGALCIREMLHWFARQPYAEPEVFTRGLFTPAVFLSILLWTGRSALEIALLSLPLLAVGLPAIWPPSRRQLVRVGSGFATFVVLVTAFHVAGHAHWIEPPWLGPVGDVIGPTGFMQGGVLFGSTRAVPDGIRLAVFVVFVLVVLSFAEALAFSRRSHPIQRNEEPQPEAGAALVLLTPFLLVYCALFLASVAIVVTLFDRYFLEVMVVLTVFLLRWHQARVSPRIPALATATLALFAFVALAGTHDLFSMARAEVRAADELQRAGIPRIQIQGGFAFDSTTQVLAWGYINDPRLLNPRGAYHPQPQPHLRPGFLYCGDPFQPYLPALRMRYVISADTSPCLAATNFAPQPYRTWLPPATRELFVGRLRTTPEDPYLPIGQSGTFPPNSAYLHTTTLPWRHAP
jgi:hypothetical protein